MSPIPSNSLVSSEAYVPFYEQEEIQKETSKIRSILTECVLSDLFIANIIKYIFYNSSISSSFNLFQVVTYTSEVTQPYLRGILSTVTCVVACVGFLIQFFLGTLLSWRQLALVNSIMPVITCLLLCIIPETPTWYMMKNRPDEARKSLAWLRGWTRTERIEKEFNELWTKIKKEDEIKKEASTCSESVALFKRKDIYKPMALLTFLYFLAQFGGASCVTVYAVPIFSSFRTPIDEYYVTVILAVIQLAGSCICISFMNVLGKRVLTFTSLAGCGVCFLATAVYIYFWDFLYLEYHVADNTTKHWVPVILVLVAAFSSNCSIGYLPWILLGEVFPDEGRSTASGVAAAFGCFISSISTKIFPTLVFSITLPGVLLIFSIVSFFGIPCLYFFLPETEGKTLHEISDHFRGAIKMDNKVKRKRKENEIDLGNVTC